MCQPFGMTFARRSTRPRCAREREYSRRGMCFQRAQARTCHAAKSRCLADRIETLDRLARRVSTLLRSVWIPPRLLRLMRITNAISGGQGSPIGWNLHNRGRRCICASRDAAKLLVVHQLLAAGDGGVVTRLPPALLRSTDRWPAARSSSRPAPAKIRVTIPAVSIISRTSRRLPNGISRKPGRFFSRIEGCAQPEIASSFSAIRMFISCQEYCCSCAQISVTSRRVKPDTSGCGRCAPRGFSQRRARQHQHNPCIGAAGWYAGGMVPHVVGVVAPADPGRASCSLPSAKRCEPLRIISAASSSRRASLPARGCAVMPRRDRLFRPPPRTVRRSLYDLWHRRPAAMKRDPRPCGSADQAATFLCRARPRSALANHAVPQLIAPNCGTDRRALPNWPRAETRHAVAAHELVDVLGAAGLLQTSPRPWARSRCRAPQAAVTKT